MSSRDPNDVEAYSRDLEDITVGDPPQLAGPIEISEYDPAWPELYEREVGRIVAVLGDRVARIEHVGSTAVPGLPAKPVIDIGMEVPDSAAEGTYVPDLQAAGYRLTIREPDWFEHRLLKGPDTDVNLHVFSARSDELDRMVLFRDHLRANDAERRRYAAAKRELAKGRWTYMQQYADAKTAVVTEILARAANR
jgi:GrpB-like predicted nucleotidyltransferase (UPF0157 family)